MLEDDKVPRSWTFKKTVLVRLYSILLLKLDSLYDISIVLGCNEKNLVAFLVRQKTSKHSGAAIRLGKLRFSSDQRR